MLSTYCCAHWAIQNRKIFALSKHIIKRGIAEGRVHRMARNPFHLAMTYLCNAGERQVIPQTIHTWSKYLDYADIHGVAPENLLGFLYQEGTKAEILVRHKRLITEYGDAFQRRSSSVIIHIKPKITGGLM